MHFEHIVRTQGSCQKSLFPPHHHLFFQKWKKNLLVLFRQLLWYPEPFLCQDLYFFRCAKVFISSDIVRCSILLLLTCRGHLIFPIIWISSFPSLKAPIVTTLPTQQPTYLYCPPPHLKMNLLFTYSIYTMPFFSVENQSNVHCSSLLHFILTMTLWGKLDWECVIGWRSPMELPCQW